MKSIKSFVILLVFSFIVIGCSSQNEDTFSPEQLKSDLTIYTTVYPLQYVVEEIGGYTVTAHSVYPPGADGHTYEPTSKEMTEFAKSDAFIYIGEGMEGFAESMADALGLQDVELIEIGKHEELFQKEGHSHGEHNHDHDGHDYHHEGHDHSQEEDEHGHQEGAINIEGLADHYHTGDTIQLTAKHSEGSEHDHWHWFTLDPNSEEWEEVDGQLDSNYEGKATIPDQQIKAILYNDDHEIVAKSEAKTITIDDHTEHDPHIWTDPLRVVKVAEIVKEELIALNPSEEALYNDNFDILKNKLTELDERFKNLLDKKENKYIIVPHAAFGYWEERYGVKQITISGFSSSDEPSQKELTEVMKSAKKYDVEYILYEQNSDSRLSKVIQEQIGAEALTIHNLEVRTEEDIENNKDYISLMDSNLDILDKVTK